MTTIFTTILAHSLPSVKKNVYRYQKYLLTFIMTMLVSTYESATRVTPHRNKPFGELVTRLVGERSNREVGRMTGVSYTYIADMAWGTVPSYEILRRFADGMEDAGLLSLEDRAALFHAAGYVDKSVTARPPPLPDLLGGEDYDGRKYWNVLADALKAEFGDTAAVEHRGGEQDPTTPKEVLLQRYFAYRRSLQAERDPNRVKW